MMYILVTHPIEDFISLMMALGTLLLGAYSDENDPQKSKRSSTSKGK
jgi:hypothetical protein